MFSVKESAQEAEEEEVMGSDYIQARVSYHKKCLA